MILNPCDTEADGGFMDTITGKRTDCGDARLDAVARFYEAFNGRDLAGLEENWAHDEDALMCNPLGGVKRGWPRIRPVYERLCSGRAKVYVELYDFVVRSGDGLFVIAGRERGRLESPSSGLDLAIRTSRVYRLDGGAWKQVHHHGSIDDPDLLRAYQSAVAAPPDSRRNP